MLISKLGEFGLIERLKERIKTDSSVIKGIGDDCAVLTFNKNKYQLFTCDMIVEGVDFTSKDDSYFIGRKALAVSLSDIAACGGIPCYCIISLGIPTNTTIKNIDKITKGMLSLAKEYNVNIVGGDISKASNLTIDVSMLGIVEKKNLVLRSSAKVGDIIFITGELGGARYGKHLKFTPRIKESRYLVKNFKINSMIDISDGLTQDLGHILKESKVGGIIYEILVPVSRYAKGLNDALSSGEDFELLFTMSPDQAKKLLKRASKVFKPIGEITGKKYGLRLIDKNNQEKILKPKGFCHF